MSDDGGLAPHTSPATQIEPKDEKHKKRKHESRKKQKHKKHKKRKKQKDDDEGKDRIQTEQKNQMMTGIVIPHEEVKLKELSSIQIEVQVPKKYVDARETAEDKSATSAMELEIKKDKENLTQVPHTPHEGPVPHTPLTPSYKQGGYGWPAPHGPPLPIGNFLWNKFQLGLDFTINQTTWISNTLLKPSQTNAINEHLEYELRIGTIKWRKIKKRLKAGGVGMFIVGSELEEKVQFSSSVGNVPFEKLRQSLLECVEQKQTFHNLITKKDQVTSHLKSYIVDRKYQDDLRVSINPTAEEKNIIAIQKTRENDIFISLTGMDVPSADICLSVSREKKKSSRDLNMTPEELKSKWFCRREKTMDTFFLGCWAIVMSNIKTIERILTRDGKYIQRNLVPIETFEVELELLYTSEQIPSFNQARENIFKEWLHIGRSLAATIGGPAVPL